MKIEKGRMEICLYKSLILPVLLYGAESWTMTSSDEQALGVFERKMAWNQELYDIYDDIDVVKRIKIQRLRWLRYVTRMDSSKPVCKVFKSSPGGASHGKGLTSVGRNR